MADGKARFEFPEVDAGTYLLVATPSTDPSGRPAYKVDAEGKVLSVASGDVEVALELAPLIPVHTLSGYEYVTAIEEC
jgi:hypothetical protein